MNRFLNSLGMSRGGNSSERSAAATGSSQPSPDSRRSMSDFWNMAMMSHMAGIAEEMNNHSRARQMGDAQLRQHYGEAFKDPKYEDVINFNSPTVHQHPKPQSSAAWTALAAAILGGSILGAGWMYRPQEGTTNQHTETTKGWILEAGGSSKK